MDILKSGRLNYILGKINQCNCVADIGCDHGLLSVALIESGRSEYVIASDISKDSLEKAYKLVLEKGLESKVDCVLSDGLAHLTDRHTDVIVIAGMGGHLISEIISKEMSVAAGPELILCPHSNADELRGFLYENGFMIKCDKTIREDRRFYPVLISEYTGIHKKISYDDAVLGINEALVIDDEYRDFLVWFCDLQSEHISEIHASGSDRAAEALKEKEMLLDAARRRLNCL